MIRDFLLREMAGQQMSQRDLARRVGCDATLVSRWVSQDNTSVPGPRYCNKLATVFGYSPGYVLKLAGHMPEDEEVEEKVEDAEREAMLAELREILDSFERSRWKDLVGTMRAVVALSNTHGDQSGSAHGRQPVDNHDNHSENPTADGHTPSEPEAVQAV